jgi:hypothetical protein
MMGTGGAGAGRSRCPKRIADAATAADREENKWVDVLRQQKDEAAREAELAALHAAIDALLDRLDE